MEIRVLLERRDAIQVPFRCKANRPTVGSHLLTHFSNISDGVLDGGTEGRK